MTYEHHRSIIRHQLHHGAWIVIRVIQLHEVLIAFQAEANSIRLFAIIDIHVYALFVSNDKKGKFTLKWSTKKKLLKVYVKGAVRARNVKDGAKITIRLP